MNIFFLIGVFFIPFDNLPFAPSMGWAAISPYFFLLHFMLNFPKILAQSINILNSPNIYFISVVFYLLISSVISWFFYGIDVDMFFTGLAKIFLGLVFFLSLLGFVVDGSGRLLIIIKILSFSYAISFFVGLIQYLNLIYPFGASSIFKVLFARYADGKVQFTFTEPSFASMHVFGVIVPIVYFAKKINLKCVWLINSAIGIVVLSIISGSSLRIIFDLFVVSILYIFFEVKKINFTLAFKVFLVVIAMIYFLPEKYSSRIESVVYGSDHAIPDPSKEIRKFRSESALYGIYKSKIKTAFGVGLFNSHLAMIDGYSDAFSGLSNVYPEILMLNYNPDGLTYSMITKWISEFGFFGFIALLISMINKKILFIYFCTIVSYLQFDSYAFYSIWIYAFFSLIVSRIDIYNLIVSSPVKQTADSQSLRRLW